MKSAVFIDRDGTLNEDKQGYISKPEDFHLFPFSASAIKLLNSLEMDVYVVTNQSGIARGYYTLQDMEAIHARMHADLAAQGAYLTDVFFSPYHYRGVAAPWNVVHEDRKPGLGMFKKALQQYHFRISSSYMIGDKESDIIFGRKAGLTTILVRTGYGEQCWMQERASWQYKPHFVVDDLLCAAQLIEKRERK